MLCYVMLCYVMLCYVMLDCCYTLPGGGNTFSALHYRGVTNEEQLVRRVLLQTRQSGRQDLHASPRLQPSERLVGFSDAPVVCDVLAQGPLAVHLQRTQTSSGNLYPTVPQARAFKHTATHRLVYLGHPVAVVLLHKALSPLLEFGFRLAAPPIERRPESVVLPTCTRRALLN